MLSVYHKHCFMSIVPMVKYYSMGCIKVAVKGYVSVWKSRGGVWERGVPLEGTVLIASERLEPLKS